MSVEYELNIHKTGEDRLNTCAHPGLLLALTRDEQRITEPNSCYSSHHVDYCSTPSLL